MAHLNYSTYLKLDELLKQQIAQSDPAEHDEMLFIVIHQTYELWFKLILHEFEKIKHDFSSNDLYGAIASFRRVRTVMKTLVGQVDILETMTPMSFTSFRDRLDTSSGFQSYQFRELEFVLGYKRPDVLKYYPPDLPGHEEMDKRLNERTVIDHFYDFLAAQGAAIPDDLRNRDVKQPNQPSKPVQDEVLKLYGSRPDLAILFEAMIDFDEGFQEWRYRHIKLVERTIGSKTGTGGSPGVDFLKKSLFLPAFADLWAVRVRM
ncbi:tryptophan 2,3-dioxygenase family protein [soil metagenome]